MIDPEYVCSVSLIILGDDLDPDVVSEELSLRPWQSWRRREHKKYIRKDGSVREFDSRHSWGGWKLLIDPEHKEDLLESKLQFWCDLLQDRIEAIDRLKVRGYHCVLDLFITTDATASIIIPVELQKAIASLGLEIQLSVITGNEKEGELQAPLPKK